MVSQRYRFRCAECGKTLDEDKVKRCSAQRYVGGNYRTPPRWRSSSICLPCLEELAERVEEKPNQRHGLVGAQWGRSSITRAIERIREREVLL